jgi:hypothetical protein
MKTTEVNQTTPFKTNNRLIILVSLILVSVSLFGQNVQIQGNATISGQVTVMDTILFADGTELASACLQVLADGDNDTRIEVEQSPDEDIIRFTIQGTEIARFENNRLELADGGGSVFIGYKAGESDDANNRKSVYIGYEAGQQTNGFGNVAVGANAMTTNNTGTENVAIGASAGYQSDGTNNVFVGRDAGRVALNGNNNTYVGHDAGRLATGSGNVLIGKSSGEIMQGSNKLAIANSATTNPLIYGEFDNNLLRVNGRLNINGVYELPETVGSSGQVLSYDGSGALQWVNPSATTSFSDVDGDTKIQVEETVNDNKIRFDIKGYQGLIIDTIAGAARIQWPSEKRNIQIGENVNSSNSSGFYNILIGKDVSSANTTGGDNVYVGNFNAYQNTTGNNNVAVGNLAGHSIITGANNVYVGRSSGLLNNGSGNTMLGHGTGQAAGGSNNAFLGINAGSINTGSENVFIGGNSGQFNTGASNVFIGFEAGKDEVGSNKLIIDNANSSLPLIYGEFDNKIVKFNSRLELNNVGLAHKGVHSITSGLSSTAIRGDATNNGNNTNYGGYFTSNGSNGHGVVGIAGSLVGNNFGGYFRAWGDNGVGIYANANGGLWSAQLFGNVEANGDVYIKNPTKANLKMHGRVGLLGSVLSRNNGDGVMYIGDIDDTGTDVHIMESGDEAITIKNGGKVGIGTISPNYSLDISGEEANDHIMRIRNKADSNDADGLLIDLDYASPGSENNFITFEANNNVAGRIEGFQWNPAGNYMDYPDVAFEDYIDIDELNSTFEEGEIILENLLSCLNPLKCPESLTFPFTPTCQECQEILSVATFTFNNLWQPQFAADYLSAVGPIFQWNLRNGILDMASGPFDVAMRSSPEYWNRYALEGDGGVTYGSKGADYAEWLEREDLSQEIKAGQIVGVKKGKISLNTKNADQIMVISVMPVVLGNMPDSTRADDFEKVAFIGQSPVWVVGDVKSGDYIIASGQNDGYGLAVSSSELTIEQIPMVVGRAWEDGDRMINLVNIAVGLKTNEMVTLISKLSSDFADLNDRVAKIEATLKDSAVAVK